MPSCSARWWARGAHVAISAEHPQAEVSAPRPCPRNGGLRHAVRRRCAPWAPGVPLQGALVKQARKPRSTLGRSSKGGSLGSKSGKSGRSGKGLGRMATRRLGSARMAEALRLQAIRQPGPAASEKRLLGRRGVTELYRGGCSSVPPASLEPKRPFARRVRRRAAAATTRAGRAAASSGSTACCSPLTGCSTLRATGACAQGPRRPQRRRGGARGERRRGRGGRRRAAAHRAARRRRGAVTTSRS